MACLAIMAHFRVDSDFLSDLSWLHTTENRKTKPKERSKWNKQKLGLLNRNSGSAFPK